MESILEAINEWIKEILIGAINGNLSTMFGDVNEKVGTIAAEVGKTPQGWNANIFSMIQNLSENVIVPIAGLVITYVLCYELISMVTEKNNMHDIETFMFFKWFFKAFVAVFLVTHRRARSTNSKYTQEIPGQGKVQGLNRPRDGGYYDDALMPTKRNKRDVWLINTVPYKGAHFAAFPPKLAETCILAGCPKGGIVIDPFFGSGTTGFAAKSLDRHYIGIELNAEYCALARARIGGAGLSSN